MFRMMLMTILLLAAGCTPKTTEPAKAEIPEQDGEVMLSVGMRAPEFTAKDDQGNTVSSRDFLGKKNVVLIFYPGDNTPGCTAQLCAVRDDWGMFQEKNVAVLGVNPADQDSKRKFTEEYSFPFPLLSDTDKEISKAYGCKGLLGFTTRTVYGINMGGEIVFAERGRPANSAILAAF